MGGGGLCWEEVIAILIKYPELDIHNFIETGTYNGQTIKQLEKYFDQLYTVELFENNFNEAKNTCNKDHIHYYLGDSVETLPQILQDVDNNSSLLFLDAHGNGNVRVPLLEEIEVILKNIKCKTGNIFIINDTRFFINNNKPWDWSHISKEAIINIFTQNHIHINDCYTSTFSDRLIIIT